MIKYHHTYVPRANEFRLGAVWRTAHDFASVRMDSPGVYIVCVYGRGCVHSGRVLRTAVRIARAHDRELHKTGTVRVSWAEMSEVDRASFRL